MKDWFFAIALGILGAFALSQHQTIVNLTAIQANTRIDLMNTQVELTQCIEESEKGFFTKTKERFITWWNEEEETEEI